MGSVGGRATNCSSFAGTFFLAKATLVLQLQEGVGDCVSA